MIALLIALAASKGATPSLLPDGVPYAASPALISEMQQITGTWKHGHDWISFTPIAKGIVRWQSMDSGNLTLIPRAYVTRHDGAFFLSFRFRDTLDATGTPVTAPGSFLDSPCYGTVRIRFPSPGKMMFETIDYDKTLPANPWLARRYRPGKTDCPFMPPDGLRPAEQQRLVLRYRTDPGGRIIFRRRPGAPRR